MKQPDLFADAIPCDPSDDGAELYTDGTWRKPGSQEGFDFAIPFAETRSMAMQRRECDERSRQAVEGFEGGFTTPEDERYWIARAIHTSVRVLEREVRAVDRGALEAGGLSLDELSPLVYALAK